MKSKWWIILIIIVVAVIIFWQKPKVDNLVSPASPNTTLNAPATFNFDSSTDLKKELNSINPQILDSDF